ALHSARALRQHQHPGSGRAGHRGCHVCGIPALDEHDLRAPLAHLANERDQVLWRWRDAGTVLDDTQLFEAERLIEVGPAVVIADERRAPVRRERVAPPARGRGDLVKERDTIAVEPYGEISTQTNQ